MCGSRAESGLAAEFFDDMPGQVILDLTMSWHRLGDTGIRVAIPIVLAAVTDEHAAQCFDALDQIDTFHAITKSSTLRMPGIWPLVISWYKSWRCSFKSSSVSPCVQ